MKVKKRRPKKHDSKLVGGVAWYRAEQWHRLLEVAEDVDDLDDTYGDWLASADRMLIESAASGLSIEKVDMDVEELLAWCNVRGMALNGKARSQCVSEKLRQKYEES